MATTLQDIAHKLEISPSLVSKVLNNRRVWASEETKERIHVTAQAMGYQPSSAARALRRGKSGMVMLALLRPDTSFFRYLYSEMIEMIAEELALAEYTLAVRVFATQTQLLSNIREVCNARSCDAVILVSPKEYAIQQGELLDEMAMPFVTFGRHEDTHPEWYQADFNHEAMMHDAVSHIAALGHKRIGYIGFDFYEPFSKNLLDGYTAALSALAGVSPHGDWTISHVTGDPDTVVEPLRRWFALPIDEQPTAAVIGAGDIAWRGLELVLAERGMRLGDDSAGFPAVGTATRDFELLFGDAHTFSGLDMLDLAKQLVSGLLIPILHGRPIPISVLRVCPSLANIPRLTMSGARLEHNFVNFSKD